MNDTNDTNATNTKYYFTHQYNAIDDTVITTVSEDLSEDQIEQIQSTGCKVSDSDEFLKMIATKFKIFAINKIYNQ